MQEVIAVRPLSHEEKLDWPSNDAQSCRLRSTRSRSWYEVNVRLYVSASTSDHGRGTMPGDIHEQRTPDARFRPAASVSSATQARSLSTDSARATRPRGVIASPRTG